MTSAKHHRQETIQKATEFFWARGFHAASMRNLQQAIDMRPGSIYASFGSKEGLFKETLRYYAASGQARLKGCVERSVSPLEGLKLFVLDSVIDSRTSAPSGICMLVKTLSELTNDHADLLAEARRLLNNVEAGFATLLEQAQAQGEIDPSRNPERLARYLQVQLMGLRAYARANESDDRIRALIDDIFDTLAGSR